MAPLAPATNTFMSPSCPPRIRDQQRETQRPTASARRRWAVEKSGGRSACGTDLLSLRALGTLRDLELDLLVLVEAAVATPLDGGEVHENIRAAVILGDEAVALLRVEPLDRACCHCSSCEARGRTPCTAPLGSAHCAWSRLPGLSAGCGSLE